VPAEAYVAWNALGTRRGGFGVLLVGLLAALAVARLPVPALPRNPRAERAGLAVGLLVVAALAVALPSPGPAPADPVDDEPVPCEVTWGSGPPSGWASLEDQGGQGFYTFGTGAPEDSLARANATVTVLRAYEPRSYEESQVTLKGPDGTEATCGGEAIGEDPERWSCSVEAEVNPRPAPSRHEATAPDRAGGPRPPARWTPEAKVPGP